jgi:PAS domain S-box-containing protein
MSLEMGDTGQIRAPLSRNARTTIAIGLFCGIGALAFALPDQHLAFLEIVPLVLIARAYGIRASIGAALVVAPVLNALQHRPGHPAPLWLGAAETFVLFIIFVAVLLFVEHYESMLARSYRSATAALDIEKLRFRELSMALPLAVRAEEAQTRERELMAIAEALPQLVWCADANGKPVYFNAAWNAYTGIDPAILKESGLRPATHPEDQEFAKARWKAAHRAGTIFEAEARLRKADGSYHWFITRAAPLVSSEGRIVRWFAICTDIDEQKRAHENLERRFEIAHRVSEAFQEASLPASLPSVPGVCFSALYKAGRHEALIGGDWYDALRLLDGRVVLSIGDVAGSGLGAAITMVGMRQAIRGAAQIHADPVAILEAADRTLRQDSPDCMVTAFVGVYDPVTRSLHYAGAGHPPPLVRRRDGSVRELRGPGLPLGVRRKGDTEPGDIVLESGSTLVLYTDGLIESTHDVIAGIRQLRDTVGDIESVAPNTFAQHIAGGALAGGANDDVAILTLSLEAEPDDARYRRWTFDSEDRFAARDVHRGFVASLVACGANDDQIRDAEVVFSELLGNVVRHARGTCDIVLDATGTLPVLSILDHGRGMTYAAHLPADAFAESGRGLYIVRALTAEFNASRRPGGGTQARAVLHVDRFAGMPRAADLAAAVA